MDSEMGRKELYTEKLMNMILDAVDDIIIIHDSQHTIIWMNRAGEKAFGRSVDQVIGKKCYSLFGNGSACADCTVNASNVGGPTSVRRRVIPGTNVVCDCSTIPYYEDGRLKLVVQHLRQVPEPVSERGPAGPASGLYLERRTLRDMEFDIAWFYGVIAAGAIYYIVLGILNKKRAKAE